MGKRVQYTLQRTDYTEHSTIGELSSAGAHLAFTLEDMVRKAGDEKIWGKTAIPSGNYQIAITRSPRFKVLMPLLLNVPKYTGVRVHSGNTADDTEGCILVGENKRSNWVGNSRAAYSKLFTLWENDIRAGNEPWIEVKNYSKHPDFKILW